MNLQEENLGAFASALRLRKKRVLEFVFLAKTPRTRKGAKSRRTGPRLW
jgi:hypothetical protein